METDETSGIKRDSVGYKQPPKEHQFKPGNKAAKHRRNGFHLKPLLRRKLAELVQGDSKARTYAEVLVETEVLRAIKKGGDSARRVWEYIEGKAEQPVDATVDGLVKIIVEYANSEGETSETS